MGLFLLLCHLKNDILSWPKRKIKGSHQIATHQGPKVKIVRKTNLNHLKIIKGITIVRNIGIMTKITILKKKGKYLLV